MYVNNDPNKFIPMIDKLTASVEMNPNWMSNQDLADNLLSVYTAVRHLRFYNYPLKPIISCLGRRYSTFYYLFCYYLFWNVS